uniref:Protein tyrosine phosphatase n=1 Tax=Glyptapanteles flavicoxis TaxID=463051 RepID=B7S8I0_9HYME|nr:protein tyrosine phosphatase [Glyptapanteles flavicoxis]
MCSKMENSCSKTLNASELLEMTNHPKFCKLVRQEHVEVLEVPLMGSTFQSSREENSKKNRYCNIPCWDDSRVIINSRDSLTFDQKDWDSSQIVITSEEIGSTYIHANYVDGYEAINKFICTQTPMEDTWETFFKLIWQENSRVIVSLTDTDRDDPKSYKLWVNSEGVETTFGRYIIKTLENREELSFTRTRVLITNTSTETSREITNFWFTDWPDNSIPTGMEEFLELRNEVNKEQSRRMKEAENGSGTLAPIVVHCSTGVGWTGTFCAIDNALEQLDKENRVSVPQIVLKIRSQRHSSVFLPEQYAFCYIVLEHVLLEKAKNGELS